MNPEEILAKLSLMTANIDAAHTQENLAKLSARAESIGAKLSGSMRKKSGFTFRDTNGNSISGMTLADVDSILSKIDAGKIDE